MRFVQLALFVTAGVLLAGCANTRNYEVIVANKTDTPITVGLVKDGPPYEQHLASVGQWAVYSPLESLPPWGIVIPPGKTADARASGSFPSGVELMLRVYRGQHSNAELMAMNKPGFSRLDVLLFPGANELIIREVGTNLDYIRVKPIPK